MPIQTQGKQAAKRRSTAAKRDQMRRVPRSDNGEAGGGAGTRLSTRRTGRAGSAATGETDGNNAICTGATICAEDSPKAGMGALRWQQGDAGSCGAGPCWPAEREPAAWLIAQCEQPDMAAEDANLQSASPSAGAISTARNSPETISLRNCILRLYTRGGQGCSSKSRTDVHEFLKLLRVCRRTYADGQRHIHPTPQVMENAIAKLDKRNTGSLDSIEQRERAMNRLPVCLYARSQTSVSLCQGA
jgi:hypothetical protein